MRAMCLSSFFLRASSNAVRTSNVVIARLLGNMKTTNVNTNNLRLASVETKAASHAYLFIDLHQSFDIMANYRLERQISLRAYISLAQKFVIHIDLHSSLCTIYFTYKIFLKIFN